MPQGSWMLPSYQKHLSALVNILNRKNCNFFKTISSHIFDQFSIAQNFKSVHSTHGHRQKDYFPKKTCDSDKEI